MHDSSAGEIAYILKGFPRLSETFIANEIHLLERMDMRLRLYSIKAGDAGGKTHDVVGRIRAPLLNIPEATSISQTGMLSWLTRNGAQFGSAHWRLVKHSPLRYVGTLCGSIGMAWRYRSGKLSGLRKVFIKEFVQAGAIAAHLCDTPDVKHLHGHFCHGATTVTWFVARLTGLPFSFTAHAKDIYQKKLNPGDLLARKMRAARFVATCTEANAQHLRTTCPACDKLHTIYHGLDISHFTPSLRDEATGSAQNETPMVLAVGRFVEKKGFSFLVEACARLRAAGRPFRCMIVGENDTETPHIQRLIREHALEDTVVLHGPVTQQELVSIYARTATFVLPCRVMDDGDRDGIPNVLVEAMAMGIPVVSTSISGIPELIEDGKDGLLVPECDPDAIAAAVERILASPALARRLGTAARDKVCERFDSQRTTRALQQLFREALGPNTTALTEGVAA